MVLLKSWQHIKGRPGEVQHLESVKIRLTLKQWHEDTGLKPPQERKQQYRVVSFLSQHQLIQKPISEGPQEQQIILNADFHIRIRVRQRRGIICLKLSINLNGAQQISGLNRVRQGEGPVCGQKGTMQNSSQQQVRRFDHNLN